MTSKIHTFDLAAHYPGFALRAKATWSAPRAALFGPSGSGKSSILEAILGLRSEVRGTVRLGGRDRHGLSTQDRGLAWVPQDAALFPHRSVRQNMLFAAAAKERIDEVAGALQIAHLLERRTTSLSGGERQRVALARALFNEPAVLLCDEPTGNLDVSTSEKIHELLIDLNRKTGQSMIVVTHDPILRREAARRVRIEQGRIGTEELAVD